MKSFSFQSRNEAGTRKFAGHLSKHLRWGDIICMFGDLGTGKTVFVKGLAAGLSIKDSKVNSPTFVLMNIYEGRKASSKSKISVYHFDLYRLENVADISLIGYEEYFYGDGIAVIEWADRLGALLPDEYLGINLKHAGRDIRKIVCKAYGARYNELLDKIKDFKA